MNRVFAGSVAGILVCGLVLAGCATSTRSLTLAKSRLDVGKPRQLLPPEALPVAGSSDGKLLAVLIHDEASNTVRLEIRDFDSQAVRYAFNWKDDEAFLPVMFSNDGSAVFGGPLTSDDSEDDPIYRMDLATGKRTMIANIPKREEEEARPGTPVIGYRNLDHSILTLGNGEFFVNAGKFVRVGKDLKRSYFDPDGNAWFRKEGAWYRLDREGNVSQMPSRPNYLVDDQSGLRGSVRIVPERIERKRNGDVAYVDILWLERADERPTDAAVAFVGADIYASGFVPGRNEIFVVSEAGCYFVPYKIEPVHRGDTPTTRSGATVKRALR